MQVNRLFIILLVALGHNFNCLSQELLDLELKGLVEQLKIEVKHRMSGQTLAIADFVDENDNSSSLGRYLAEEFSYTLVNEATDFEVIDRTHLRTLLKEAKLGDKGMLDPNTVKSIGHLKGVSAVVYGKLIPLGNVVRIFIKIVILETQVNEIVIRGTLTRTKTLESLLGLSTQEAETNDLSESENKKLAPSNVYSYQNIKLNLKKCMRRNEFLDCEFEVSSVGQNDNFSVLTSDTQLTDNNQKSYRASSLSMGGNSSSVLVNYAMRADTPVALTVRFNNIPASYNSIETLELNCKSYNAFSFNAIFSNIKINN